jgi:hypothetical protein
MCFLWLPMVWALIERSMAIVLVVLPRPIRVNTPASRDVRISSVTGPATVIARSERAASSIFCNLENRVRDRNRTVKIHREEAA